MRIVKLCGFMLAIALLIRPAAVSADWAYPFVVYSGSIYVVTDTVVEPERIGNLLGKVTRYSDREGTYSGNFSNAFPKGTRCYAIEGMSEKQGIAVRTEDGRYVLSEYGGKYGGSLYASEGMSEEQESGGEYEESLSDRLGGLKGWLLGAAAVVFAVIGYRHRRHR
ncbi:hypothetical protein B1A99_10105 [Cohnella sp. CIP 111063]|jgi:hypothetical protein|uniref:hypothetical protein n=1 Tax=unclassified Cohnella TaxID=2636738 RepID=UPI000B8BE62D|nr:MULTISPECIES: hypothetical protein [unclassified Cohnella]OXS59881.1 hypothetical protein B1A99_10105 [Cohnella sp. CIP 111063]PRX72680.1 hypothetical protein B0G52_105233 [Cohnella sp. SGD-V74]